MKKYPLTIQQVKCIYKLMLIEDGNIYNLKEIFDLYSDYGSIKDRARRIKFAPSILKCMPNLVMPKYLEFLKDYSI